ncbi:hypothetical protein ACFYVL_17240 [Streptomyces sp. NPDC004111]|uniref:hypothetical protein n=1 Tax=Streptomyces sp. NPDC004111 TaxID=3364690 RepID=UPI0036CDEAE6
MRVGMFVWLCQDDGGHLADAQGTPVRFEIGEVHTTASGTFYLLSTPHPVAQDIFGGWHTGQRLTLTKGPVS